MGASSDPLVNRGGSSGHEVHVRVRVRAGRDLYAVARVVDLVLARLGGDVDWNDLEPDFLRPGWWDVVVALEDPEIGTVGDTGIYVGVVRDVLKRLGVEAPDGVEVVTGTHRAHASIAGAACHAAVSPFVEEIVVELWDEAGIDPDVPRYEELRGRDGVLDPDTHASLVEMWFVRAVTSQIWFTVDLEADNLAVATPILNELLQHVDCTVDDVTIVRHDLCEGDGLRVRIYHSAEGGDPALLLEDMVHKFNNTSVLSASSVAFTVSDTIAAARWSSESSPVKQFEIDVSQDWQRQYEDDTHE